MWHINIKLKQWFHINFVTRWMHKLKNEIIIDFDLIISQENQIVWCRLEKEKFTFIKLKGINLWKQVILF